MTRPLAAGVACVVIALCALVTGCGHSSASQAADADPVQPVVTLDHHLNEPARWSSPKVSKQPDGTFVARLAREGSAAGSSSAEVSLGGLGWPRTGNGFGQSYVGPGPLSPWTGDGESYTVSLTTSARRVSAEVWNLGGRFQVRVGSAAIGNPKPIGSSDHHHDIDVAFATPARRTITFVLAGPAYFSGLRIGGGNTQVSLPSAPHPAPPSTYWLGDSYVAGGGSTYPDFDDLAHLASTQAGLSDVTVDALGGTGYVKTNAAAHFPPFLTRARRNLGGRHAQPKVIIVGGSINDAVYSAARVSRAAAALYAYLGRAVPSAHVIVVTFSSAYPVPGAEAAANQGILTAARAAPNVVGVLDLAARVDTLGGSVGAERRSGALESRVVMYHPSELGHRVYGRIIGTFLTQCVRKLDTGTASRGMCSEPS